MNRMEEYRALQAALEQPVPALENTLDRAQKRVRRRRRLVLRPLAGLAASFALFVALVNFSAPVAYACSQVPFLRELAEAVTFSRSLTDAVDNQYVQPISLTQTDGGVTASVEYLIVDQKQVNVFFRLESEEHTGLNIDPEMRAADGGALEGCSYGLNDWDVPNGKLQSVTLDFIERDVPDCLRMRLKVYGENAYRGEAAAPPEAGGDPMFEELAWDPEYLAEFDFLLEFDPQFTAAGKVYPIHQTVELEGQKITITDMEVYPTHLRVNVADDPGNTAWLKRLYFYIETDWGMKFDTVSNGIVATGSLDSPTMTSYRADSTYFYKADHLSIVITGAEWLNKDMERTYVNLRTGETGPLPEGVTFLSAEKEEQGWLVTFKARQRKPDFHHQLFGWTFYDAQGSQYEIRSWGSGGIDLPEAEQETHFTVQFPLKDFHDDQVWLCPQYSHLWTAEDLTVVPVQ